MTRLYPEIIIKKIIIINKYQNLMKICLQSILVTTTVLIILVQTIKKMVSNLTVLSPNKILHWVVIFYF
jgi:hypothetical protein